MNFDLSSLELTVLPESLCELSQLRRLVISNNQLTALPERLSRLTQLQSLVASGNQLTALPDALNCLAQLRELVVDNNQLTALPGWLKRLSELEVLVASNNALTALPDFFDHLPDIHSLDVAHNNISVLPESLGRLTKLTRPDVAGNRLAELPQSINQLAHLEYLNIGSNELKTLPASLTTLPELKEISAPRNQIGEVPEFISTLTHLRMLNLEGNKLTEIHESLRQLKCLERLYLDSNELLEIPKEILGPNLSESGDKPATLPSAILDYFFRTKRGRRPLNEAKLILVGRGGVGKTCLIKRMVAETFDEGEQETPGIQVQPWEIILASGDAVRLHVWDFGGQRILHGAHQFFLTERTLYLLVLSGREDSATQDAEYWLQLIKSFGGDSRVIVVLNKQNRHPFDVNRGLLHEKYPFIAEFVKTDCKDPTCGLDRLRELLESETDALEHRKTYFPVEWFAIKERVANMPGNYITWDEFQEICRELGEKDLGARRDLAKYLHILGIALNYSDDPRLQDTRVLKPSWVTEGLYTLLRAGQKDNGGVLCPRDVANVLDPVQYPACKHDFLLSLMDRFQLCFRLPGQEERYLVPELLGENQPDLKELGVDLPLRLESMS